MEQTLKKVKRINISSKRQITLPQSFYVSLEFTDEADCYIRDGEIVIRPVRKNATGELDDLLLEDLIKEGYSGEDLLQEFRKRKNLVRPAAQKLIKDSEMLAKDGKLYTVKDVFGEN